MQCDRIHGTAKNSIIITQYSTLTPYGQVSNKTAEGKRHDPEIRHEFTLTLWRSDINKPDVKEQETA